jgi:4-amino-4-deoxy-L-arabinose transferase-like glycosyltransferase
MASAADTDPVPPAAAADEAGGASSLLLTLARVGPFAIWAVVILGAFLSRPPTAPIELETLSTAWHMLQSGSWVPLLNGELAPHIPPLHDWLILAGWQVFGVGEIWPRLLSALAALAALLLVGTAARTLWPHRATTQIFARILMAGLGGFIITASMNTPDVAALPI